MSEPGSRDEAVCEPDAAAAAIPGRAWIEGRCPRCEAGWQCPARDPERPACSSCGEAAAPLHAGIVEPDGSLRGCLACGHDEMYWARDFPRAIGIGVVVVAALLAPFTYYVSLAVGAMVDASLVFFVKKRLHCYGCGAIHHAFAGAGVHWRPFALDVSDRHRFGERAAVLQTLGAGHEPARARRRVDEEEQARPAGS